MPHDIRLGLCCICVELREQGIFNSRTCRVDTVQAKGASILIEKARQNILDLIPMLIYNELHNIKVFRMSSDMFPHLTNPALPRYDDYSLPIFADLLTYVGRLAQLLGHRLTFHPGQFNVIGTPCERVFQATVRELSLHADILDMLHCDRQSVMVVHGGGVYGDKKMTMQRWVANYKRLPYKVQRRLVLENCERSYSVEDCLQLSAAVGGLPVVLDVHHYECYKVNHPDEAQLPLSELLPLVLDTWRERGIRCKLHISSQGEGRVGKHADHIRHLHAELLTLAEPFDLMVEAKAKEKAIFSLRDRYPELVDASYQPHPIVTKFTSLYPTLFKDIPCEPNLP